MARKSDSHASQPRTRGRRRVAIVGLSALLATLIAVPAAAPIVGGSAFMLLIWGVWTRPADRDSLPDRREPVIWDDGFGAT